jgi:hypothetical protein
MERVAVGPRIIEFGPYRVRGKRSLGFAHRFRPTYARANVKHPSFSYGLFYYDPAYWDSLELLSFGR